MTNVLCGCLRVGGIKSHQRERWSHTQSDGYCYIQTPARFFAAVFFHASGVRLLRTWRQTASCISPAPRAHETNVHERICNGHATSHSSARAQPLGRCKNARAMTHAAPNRQLLCCVDLLMAEKKPNTPTVMFVPGEKLLYYTLVLGRGFSRRLTWPSGVTHTALG